MAEFHVKTSENGKLQGPFSSGQLKKLVGQGKLRPEHLVSSNGGASWHPATRVSGLEFESRPSRVEATPAASPTDSPGNTIRASVESDRAWRPENDVTTHFGEPVVREMDFFSPPPIAIGEIVTALSMDTHSKRMRILSVGGGALFGLLGLLAIGVGLNVGSGESGPLFVVGTCSIILGLRMSATLLRTTSVITYVGSRGLARITSKKSRNRPAVAVEELLLFEEARELRGHVTFIDRDLVTQQFWSYEWLDDDQRSLFRIRGSKDFGSDLPTSERHFGTSAENAWSIFLLNRFTAQFEERGMVKFRLNKRDVIRVGAGFLEFDVKGKTTRLTPEDVKLFSLESGKFQIKTHDASWFGSKGTWSFDYGQLSNARAFLLVVDHVGDFTFV